MQWRSCRSISSVYEPMRYIVLCISQSHTHLCWTMDYLPTWHLARQSPSLSPSLPLLSFPPFFHSSLLPFLLPSLPSFLSPSLLLSFPSSLLMKIGKVYHMKEACVYRSKGVLGWKGPHLQTVTSHTPWIGIPMLPGMYKNATISSTYG